MNPTPPPTSSGRYTPPAPAPTAGRLRLSGDGTGDMRRTHGDDGYALALVTLLLIPLMVFVAFAVDLGAWYAQSSRLQRATDAAAMAGVVWLPSASKAQTAAFAAAKSNGFDPAVYTVTVNIPGNGTDYGVSIAAPAPRIVSQIFQKNAFNITRSAVARFNKKIPLGSPSNMFGNDVSGCPNYQPVSPCGSVQQPLLWSAINSPYNIHANGDPFNVKCTTASGNSPTSVCDNASAANGATNPDYRKTGNDYAIEISAADVAAGYTFNVQVWDAGEYRRTTGPNATVTEGDGTTSPTDCRSTVSPFSSAAYSGYTYQHCQTGDGDIGPTGANDAAKRTSSAANFDAQLWQNDGSDLTINYAAKQLSTTGTACNLRVLRSTANSAATYKNQWRSVCTFQPTQAGIFPLRIKSSALDTPTVTDAGSGINAYSLRVVGGTNPRVYAINDMSLWTNTPGSTAKFYLAEVGPEHAGKKMVLDMYDPGDGNGGDYTIYLRAPAAANGASPMPGVPTGGTPITNCLYNDTPSVTMYSGDPPDTAANCSVVTRISGTNKYNDRWLRMVYQIPTTYDCGPTKAVKDCWWTINYTFAGASLPTDRTVWALTIVGDPVHLVG